VYPILGQPIVPPTYIPYSIGNQFPTTVQPMTSKDRQLVQKPIIVLVPTTIQVTTSLPAYVPRGSAHQPLDGGQPKDSPRGDLPRERPFNRPIGSFGWQVLDSCMFIPPWYQSHGVQPILKPTTKLPYMKLQYLTYIKDIDPDAHIKLLKNALKTNGEIMEADIINLFGFTLMDSIIEWGENYVQYHPNYTFEKFEQAFCKRFKIVKNNEEMYMQL
jgi:hypothetical protein